MNDYDKHEAVKTFEDMIHIIRNTSEPELASLRMHSYMEIYDREVERLLTTLELLTACIKSFKQVKK
jgi:hypothetical protein